MLDIYTPEDDPLRVETCSNFLPYNKTNIDTVVSILFYFVCVDGPQSTRSQFKTFSSAFVLFIFFYH
jgi:hypothetical protein